MNNLFARQRLPAEPRIIAIGGGAGGTGRSTFAADLARGLARRGRRVLVVDADLSNPTQALRLGFDRDRIPTTRIEEEEDLGHLVAQPSRKGRPALLSLGHVAAAPSGGSRLDPGRLIGGFRALDYDDVVVDLPAGTCRVWLGVFVRADVPIFFCPTEATSVLATARSARAALVAATEAIAGRRFDDLAERAPDEARDAWLDAAIGCGAASAVNTATTRLETYLVLGQVRETAERELGHAIAASFSYLVDVWPRYLGACEHDDRRWFHLRHDPKSTDAPTEPAVEALVAQLAELSAFDADHPRCSRAAASAPRDVLGVGERVDPTEIRQHYRRLWEGFRRDSPLTTLVLPTRIREQAIRELEDANRALQAQLAERTPVPVATPPEPKGAKPGDAIRDARVAAGLSQRELSLQTRIGLRVLEAIERFEVEDLPRPVYLRGYLREIAAVLDLDADRVMDEYLTAISDVRNARILSRSTPRRS